MLTALIAIPALGALLLAFLPKGKDALAKYTALAVTLVVAVLTVVMAIRFDSGGPRFQFTEKYWWIRSFHVHYAVGVDGVALVLILLSAILVPLVVLASWNDAERSGGVEEPPKRSVKAYFALLLALEAMMIGVFAATDIFLFYVFFEAMLIPMYFIIGSYGGPQRSYAAVKFLLYSLFGGLLMLAAVIGLYVVSANDGNGTFLFSELTRITSSRPRPSGCSSASSSPSRSRRPWCPSTRGCRMPRARRPPARRCCWSVCWTRSARTACCASASSCSPAPPSGSPRWC